METHAIIFAEHDDFESDNFLNEVRFSLFKVWILLEVFDGNVSNVPKEKNTF